MEKKKRVGIALLCLLCLSYIIVPSPSLLSTTIQVVPLSISGVYYHYFRKHLETIPAGSTTVNHYIFKSLTWIAQTFIVYIVLISLASTLFQSSLDSFAENYPWTTCSVLSPVPLAILLGMHFLFMSAMKLFITILPHRFLEINHENLWRYIKGTILLIKSSN